MNFIISFYLVIGLAIALLTNIAYTKNGNPFLSKEDNMKFLPALGFNIKLTILWPVVIKGFCDAFAASFKTSFKKSYDEAKRKRGEK